MHYFARYFLIFTDIFYFITFQVLTLMLGRLALVGVFVKNEIYLAHIESFSKVFFRGFQFDVKAAVCLSLPLFGIKILNDIFYDYLKFRGFCDVFVRFYERIILILTGVLCVLNVGFYQEYHDQFNHWVLGLWYDDVSAILSTIWKTYPVMLIMFAVSITAFLMIYVYVKGYFIFRYWLNKRCYQLSRLFYVCAISFMAGVYLLGLRGSISSRPLKVEHMDVTADERLNTYVLNPYFALYGVWKTHLMLHKGFSTEGLKAFWVDGGVDDLYRYLFREKEVQGFDMEGFGLKVSRNSCLAHRPRHIFLIVMESQDAWPLLPAYDSLGLNPYLKKFAAQGLSFQPFLSASDGTIGSLVALMTGLYDAELNINYQKRGMQPFRTSIAPIMHRLGYETRFIYGGYLTWQKIGEFAVNQGFDKVLGGAQMGSLLNQDWGVKDEVLFDFIFKHIDQNSSTFNLIMTSSNHPPYTLEASDLAAAGWSMTQIPDDLDDVYDEKVAMRILGHTRYADWAVGCFIEKVQKQFPDSLFIITGDHNSRKFLNDQPSIYERRCVPCIFYGKGITRDLKSNHIRAGDHLDILPTLVEFISPDGFIYNSFGENLLIEVNNSVGYGASFIVTNDYITGLLTQTIQPLPKFLIDDIMSAGNDDVYRNNQINDMRAAEHRKRYRAWQGMSWVQVFGN